MAPHNLKRIVLVKNKHYQRDGLKSYAHLLRKYNIVPTKEGPFYWAKHAHHQGKFGAQKSIGGKTHMEPHILMKHEHHEAARHKHHGTQPTPTPPTAPPTEPPTTGGGTASGTISTQPGTVQATDTQNDSEYLCPVTIGTPGQTFMLDFDTGSADLWLWSTELPQSTISSSGSSHTIYNSADSSTFKNQSGSTWTISYGDGSSASGTVGTDNVTLGGLTIKNQAIELAKTLSSSFASGAGDGLLGLAWDNINTVQPTPVKTPTDNLISQDDIPANMGLFTAYLGSYHDTDNTDKGESFYTFGYIDQDVLNSAGVAEADIHYTPIDNSQGFWQFSSTQVVVNGTATTQSGNTSIADTGTTLCLVSDAVCEAIYNAIPGGKYDSSQQGYVFPSSVTAAQLPVVQFDIGGQLFTLQKEDLAFADAGNGSVYGGVQSRGQQNFDIYGDTLLKSIYAVFDIQNKRFGAVQRTEATQNVSVPASS